MKSFEIFSCEKCGNSTCVCNKKRNYSLNSYHRKQKLKTVKKIDSSKQIQSKLELIKPVGYKTPSEEEITNEAIKYSRKVSVDFVGELPENHDIIMFRCGAHYILELISKMIHENK
jgi:hypothetical protein